MDDRITAGSPARLDPEQADKLLSRFKVPSVPQRVVYSPEPEDAVRASEEFGYPVVLKAFTRTLVHKSDIGGVRMFLHDDHQVERAATEIQERVPDLIGYLLQSQAPGGHEVMIECSRRAGFGPVIQVGLGGGWSDLVEDVSVRIAPIDHQTAREMLDELRGAPLLHGYHGARAANIDALVEMLVNLSRLVVETPEVLQLDVNPAIAGAYEVVTVDTRVFWDETRISGQTALAATVEESVAAVRRLFEPGSIAVVGELRDEDDAGRRLLGALQSHGFAGKLYPVDSGLTEVLDLPSYPTLSALPAVPDLALVVESPELVTETVRACGDLGISTALVYTVGAEIPAAELQEIIRETGIRICGPETAGVVSRSTGLHAALDPVPVLSGVPSGGIALLTQSGSLGSWLLGQTLETGAGLSYWIDSGQESNLHLSDYLHFLVGDPDTRVIAIYLETLRAPGSFLNALERARSAGKPVLVYRPTGSEPDRAVAGDNRAFNAALRHTGAARAPDLQSLADAALALSWQPLPHGRGIGVIATSTGALRVITDKCSQHRLVLPELGQETLERIRDTESRIETTGNPIEIGSDVAGDPASLGELVDALLPDPTVDSLLLVLSSRAGTPGQHLAAGISRTARRCGKPVLVCMPGPESAIADARAAFNAEQIPFFSTPERAVTAVRLIVDISEGHHQRYEV